MRNKNVYYFIYIIFVIFMLLNIVVTPAFVLFTYNSYEGVTSGTVEDVQSRRSGRHRKYRVTYSYTVDDIIHTNISPYGRGARGSVGQEIVVRYDPENPEAAMTSLEAIHAEASFVAGFIIIGIIVIVNLINKRKQNNRARGE